MRILQSTHKESGFQLLFINIIIELNVQEIVKAQAKECDIINLILLIIGSERTQFEDFVKQSHLKDYVLFF